MNIEKLYWKTLYYWIRYLNYDVISRDKDDAEIWLVHKRKQSVVIFRKDVSTTQEVRFDKSRILDHQDDLAQKIGFKPSSYNFITLLIGNFLKKNKRK